MTRKNLPTIASFASMNDPVQFGAELWKRLNGVRKETRYVEWKRFLPVGEYNLKAYKYRIVKTIIGFANTDGGFIIFGVTPTGSWEGLDPSILRSIDPAHFVELVSECVSPDIVQLNYADFTINSRQFALLHTPPSKAAPHVTTRQVVDKDTHGRPVQVLAKYSVYARYGAKTDYATPSQHQVILSRRLESLREQLLTRIREVPVPIPVSIKGSHGDHTGIRVAKATSDPSAPSVRLVRAGEPASGVYLHEELSDGLFDEINNVIEANFKLAGKREIFVLGEPIYYRIYAERQHVDNIHRRFNILANTAICSLYAPSLFWLNSLTAMEIATILRRAIIEQKTPEMYGVIRIAVLLGEKTSDWLWGVIEKKWERNAQKPDFFWAFQSIRKRTSVKDRILLALQTSPQAQLETSGTAEATTIGDLLSEPQRAANVLSHVCMKIFNDEKKYKVLSRKLDILSYGKYIATREGDILSQLKKIKP